MASKFAPEETIFDGDEEAYDEAEDEDFDPNAADANGGESSGDDDANEAAISELTKTPKGRRKQKETRNEDAEDIGFENSGDEAIVKKGSRRKRKHDGDVEDDNDSGGEGGYVKTRSMRATAAEEKSRKPLATAQGATIDVEALWAEMNDPGKAQEKTGQQDSVREEETRSRETARPADKHSEDMIEIEETFKFAGEVQKQTRLVPKSSEEAQRWLKSKAEQEEADSRDAAAKMSAKRHPETGEPLLRPLRRVSLWDPNPTGVVKGIPANILNDSTAGNKLRVVDKSKLDWHSEERTAKTQKATKLNVVEKSKMDWQAHVDEIGDKEDLAKAAKAKGSYLERRDFLERVEARKDEDERRFRVK